MKVVTSVRKNEYQLRGKQVELPCKDLQHGAQVFRDFLWENDLGASLCDEAFIKEGKKILCRVSYNGRLWDIETDEPLYE